MPAVRFLSDYLKHRTGNVVDVRQGYADALIRRGLVAYENPISAPRDNMVTLQTEDGRNNIKLVGFPLVSTAGTWGYLHNPPNHIPSPSKASAESITQTATTIAVPFGLTFTSIITSAITPDDTLAQADVIVGASVGFSSCTIYFEQGGAQVNPNIAGMYNGNVFVLVIGIE